MSQDPLYVGREQTLIKHFILREYLERLALIVGRWNDSITYVDCFSGPWNVQSNELKDSSFCIALDELRKARLALKKQNKELELRCLFMEKATGPYKKLKQFADQVPDAEVKTVNGELTGNVGGICEFVRQGRKTFPFIFIDPTGWTGFEMKLMAPLLRLQPGEVLINFMTDYIRRFIDHPDQQTRRQFADLFGSEGVKDQIQDLRDIEDREDALFQAYADNVRATGGYRYACAAIVLHPAIDRTFFHLIYATRNRKGVEVFKDVERRAMTVMERTRAEVKQRERVKKSKQKELFSALDMPRSAPIERMRDRYLDKAKEKILKCLHTKDPVAYEEVWDLALSFPLVWESDLKDWLITWRAKESLEIRGLHPGRRVPKLNQGHILLWKDPIG